jgi:integrase
MQAHVIPRLGRKRLFDLTRFDLQMHLNGFDPKYSGSIVRKVRTWVKAVLAEAVDQGFLEQNPARRLELPITRESSKRFLSLAEIGRLLSATEGRDHLILRLFIECGPRPGELFAARWGSLTESQLFIREAIAKAAEGRAIGKTKTAESKKAIALPAALVASLRLRRQAQGWPADEAFIFASRRGTPLTSANYLNRFLKPLGATLRIHGINYQVFRRTFSTHFQRHATIKETQTQMRHTDAATTLGIYAQTIPEGLAAAVEAFDREITGVLNTNEHKFEM